jgi:glucokinase
MRELLALIRFARPTGDSMRLVTVNNDKQNHVTKPLEPLPGVPLSVCLEDASQPTLEKYLRDIRKAVAENCRFSVVLPSATLIKDATLALTNRHLQTVTRRLSRLLQ